MSPDPIRIPCPAKLNLTLAVGPPRDDGMHPLASVMVPIALHDVLTLQKPQSGSSKFAREVAEDCPSPFEINWPVESDLGFRAHQLLEQTLGRALPIDSHIRKTIPIGAGLGGGSSNAAGMLVGLRSLYELNVPDKGLIELGLLLGSDVGFAVNALLTQQAGLVSGIGDVVTPLPSLPRFDLALIFPEGNCSTADVYRAFDAHSVPTPLKSLEKLAQTWRLPGRLPDPVNDLQTAAIQTCPELVDVISILKFHGNEAHLTGSGSTLFVLADNASQAQECVDRAKQSELNSCSSYYDPPPAHD